MFLEEVSERFLFEFRLNLVNAAQLICFI